MAMTLGQKTLTILFVTIVGLMAGLYALARFVVMRGFYDLEQQQTRTTVERVRNQMQDDIQDLAKTANDYGAWDRMYGLMEPPSPKLIALEFQDGTVQGLRINSVIVADNEEHVVFAKGYDFHTRRAVPLPPRSPQALVQDPWVRRVHASGGPASGILLQPDGAVLIAACPILTAGRQGPSRGVVVMTRNVDLAFLLDMQDLTRTRLAYDFPSDPRLPSDFVWAQRVLLSGTEAVPVHADDPDTIYGFALFKDVHGDPALLLRADLDRRISQRGLASMHYVLAALAGVAVVFCLLTYFLLRSVVLSRLTRMEARVREIGNHRSTTERLPVLHHDEIGKLAGSINSMLDALRESDTQLRFLAENIRQVFWVKDVATQKITYVSPSYQKIWGRPCESLYADPLSWMPMVHPEDRGIVEDMLNRQRQQDSGEVEFRIIRPNGETSWMWERYFPIFDKDGKLTQYAGLMDDISEYKDAEQVLIHSQKELWDVMVQRRERLRAIGSLASGIAHEIKTPAQFVGDNLRFMRDSYPGLARLVDEYERLYEELLRGNASPQALEKIKHAREHADLHFLREQFPLTLEQTLEGISRISDICRAMKEFAYTDAAYAQAPVDLNHAVESTITITRNEWKYVAEVETDFGILSPVVCRASEMNQVFLNLLVNAAHAIADAVRGTTRKGKITVRTRQEGAWALVSVSDTGTGIPDAIKDRIFEPFFTTKKERGTGQGLAITRSVVEAHAGTLTFDSVVGKGTVFQVRIPVEGIEAEVAAGAAAAN